MVTVPICTVTVWIPPLPDQWDEQRSFSFIRYTSYVGAVVKWQISPVSLPIPPHLTQWKLLWLLQTGSSASAVLFLRPPTLWCISHSCSSMGGQEFVRRVSSTELLSILALVSSLQIRDQEWVVGPAGGRGKQFSVTFADMPYSQMEP